jgi:hypothetical protein
LVAECWTGVSRGEGERMKPKDKVTKIDARKFADIFIGWEHDNDNGGMPCDVACYSVILTCCAEYVKRHPECKAVVSRAFAHVFDENAGAVIDADPWRPELVLNTHCIRSGSDNAT